MHAGIRPHPKRSLWLAPNYQLIIGLSGGGGIRSPRARDLEAVRRDVLDGFVSEQAARDVYGVVLSPVRAVDRAETARLRQPFSG